MLPVRRLPELVPNYSLTGDLVSFMRCGLQYRYHNGSALPPSRPVQMWFGEFIHGVMETAYRTWLAHHPPFPWPCTPTVHGAPPPPARPVQDIGAIGDLVESTLAAAGKSPRSRTLRESAYQRAERAVNEIGPQLFPLVRSAEEKVIGTRPIPGPPGRSARARMYELHGIMDVLSSVSVHTSPDNVLSGAVRQAVPELPAGAELIVDYKGARRPPVDDPYWEQGDWQLQMYAWLRAQQPGAAPVAAGVLLYVNELVPGASATGALRRENEQGRTDVRPVPGSRDDYLLRTWRPGAMTPPFSADFRMRRAIRVIPITPPSIGVAVRQFDKVVVDIEACVAREALHGKIVAHWPASGDEPTCVACDFRHFCPSPASARSVRNYQPPAPRAP